MKSFGSGKNGTVDFRWPSEANLEALNLTEPLKLTEIRTKDAGGALGMIQLVFEGGIESPVFDTGPGNVNQAQTYNVRDSPMIGLTVRVFGSYLNHLLVSYQDG